MGQRHHDLSPEHIRFIQSQPMYFVATAPAEGHVNLSPKGLDSLRVLDSRTVAWLNVTGSGNETAAHVLENGRMTLMFCAFEGKPLILRVYGKARVVHAHDAEWAQWLEGFEMRAGARQIFLLDVELVQTSCGMGVPLLDYQGQREQLVEWTENKGENGIAEYWERKNRLSLDGRPTGIFGDVSETGTDPDKG